MKLRDRFAELARKYKHAWVFLYILIYMPWFMWLEKHVTTHYHVIQIRLDEHIPFIEYFIIPYLMWFLFIAVVFLYFFFTDVKGFYKLAAFMFTGMTVFLIISTVFPNGQDLRPVIFERDNIFVDMVRTLYRTDTCTNVFPSLHVFNSLSVCAAIADSEALKKHRGVCIGAYVLATDGMRRNTRDRGGSGRCSRINRKTRRKIYNEKSYAYRRPPDGETARRTLRGFSAAQGRASEYRRL